MREKIWYEMLHKKLGDTYLVLYLSRQRSMRKWFKIITLIFSTSGIFSWAIWQNGVLPFIACIVIAAIQLLTLIENQLVLNEKDLDNIADLRKLYTTYVNQIEELWTDFNTDIITEIQAKERFYELRKLSETIEAADNRLDIRNIKSVYNAADIATRDYLSEYHS